MSQASASKKRKADSNTPAPSAPSPYSMPQGSRTPTPGWSGHPSQIPIDPALQQQPQQQPQQPQHQQQQQQQQHPPPPQHPQHQQYHPGASYYPQYNYGGGYPPPSWPAQPRPQQQAAPQMHALPQQAQPQQQQPQQQQRPGSELDTADVATLNDALGSAGVDLRAEEENLRQSHSQSQSQTQSQPRGPQRSRAKKQGTKAVIDQSHLGARMRSIAALHALQPGAASVPEDTVAYLALALRVRLSKLIEGMAAASAHREETGVLRPPGMYEDGTPMWAQVVRRDVAKQLALLERVEREEELAARRERKARDAYAAGGQAALPSLDDALPMEEEEPKKKKKKPDGPGVTAKNMSEDMKKKLSNAVASQAAGLGTGKYAWMNAGNVPAGPPAKKVAGASSTPAQQSGSGWSKPYQAAGKKKEDTPVEEDNRRAVTLRDAIFVVERERGHGGGRGAARGWT